MRVVLTSIFIVLFSQPVMAQSNLDRFKIPLFTAESLDVNDLGFGKEDTQSNFKLQKDLEERTRMLQNHQLWGLVSVAAMGAALLSGGEGNLPPEHPFLAGLALGTYSVSAYYALAAPDRPEGASYGQLNLHRWLAWIHLPGMILTPVAGYLAAKQYEKNEPLTGLAAQHKNIAGITAITLAISAALVTFEF
ncbi:MAG: hypothetical protein KDD33_01930 [Bdellovibrionales bacterium]|nr:hypothetical protein [Bdellovibrionales bacterium]